MDGWMDGWMDVCMGVCACVRACGAWISLFSLPHDVLKYF